ncbi:copper chaperone PCu(A)C [Anaerolinea thermophila]|uniref:Copper chaperone PCu(A)C n=1 Tax=Anaerolinea thermophila (strain DSM 14523 / JCM 11388 / NBRC 100420 / UNI-1) TaxID=926569 RepID=E8N388_ANATU|nr:copper chaperone PCu(A)C [Anaerolinea thermophila]BAJ62902.1 hypothetical protein ANT_08680 [Anaerolinea thermophila UNI-1]
MMKIAHRIGLGLFLSVILLMSACASRQSNLTIQDPWARLGVAGGNSAIYLKIENATKEDDALISASCDAAMMTELHMTQMMDDGTMKMEPQEKISIPAGQTVELKPGGLHIMLMNLKKDLKTGDTLNLKLKFEKSGEIEVSVPVKEP